MPGFVAERCRWQMQRGEDGAAVKICRRYKPKQILGTARGHSLTFCPCETKKTPSARRFLIEIILNHIFKKAVIVDNNFCKTYNRIKDLIEKVFNMKSI